MNLAVFASIAAAGFVETITLDEQAWAQSAEGAPPFAGEPVVIEVIAQTASGYLTGIAATFSPQDFSASGNRQLIEERLAGPEPVLGVGVSLPAPAPCY